MKPGLRPLVRTVIPVLPERVQQPPCGLSPMLPLSVARLGAIGRDGRSRQSSRRLRRRNPGKIEKPRSSVTHSQPCSIASARVVGGFPSAGAFSQGHGTCANGRRGPPAVDNWPPAARLLAVAAAGQFPTAAPSPSERFSIGKSEKFSVGIDTESAPLCRRLGQPVPVARAMLRIRPESGHEGH